MPISKRTLLYSAGLAISIGPARGLTPPLYDIPEDDLRRTLERGATLVGYLESRLFVERYESGGKLRGTYAGRAYEGRWRLDGFHLCTQVAPAAPLCVILRGSASGPMADGLHLWLFPVARRPAMSATYHTRAPWETRSPLVTVRVRVLSPGADSFAAMGTVEGLPQHFTVWAGRRLNFDRQQDVMIHGTTDGVTFTAERVTQLDGAPLQ